MESIIDHYHLETMRCVHALLLCEQCNTIREQYVHLHVVQRCLYDLIWGEKLQKKNNKMALQFKTGPPDLFRTEPWLLPSLMERGRCAALLLLSTFDRLTFRGPQGHRPLTLPCGQFSCSFPYSASFIYLFIYVCWASAYSEEHIQLMFYILGSSVPTCTLSRALRKGICNLWDWKIFFAEPICCWQCGVMVR